MEDKIISNDENNLESQLSDGTKDLSSIKNESVQNDDNDQSESLDQGDAVSWKHFLLFIALFLGLSFAIGTIIGVFAVFLGEDVVQLMTTGYIGLLLDAAIFTIALFSYKRIKKFLFRAVDFKVLRDKKIYLYLLIGFAILALSQYLFLELLKIDNASKQPADLGVNEVQSSLEYILFFLSIVFITPIKEELIYRGFIHRFLQKRHHFWLGLVVSSLIFGLAHFGFPFSATTMGIVFVLLYRYTNSLVPGMILHILWNLFAVLTLLLA